MSDQQERDRCRPDDEETAEREATEVRVPRELADVDRRRVLGAIGGGGTVAIAGCMGLFETEEEEDPYANPGDDDDDDGDDGGDDEGTFDVEFLAQGETLAVAEDEELLYAGLDEGWDLPYSCEVGSCGVCEAHVEGDGHDLVEMTANDALSDDEVGDGAILTCTAQPRDEFAIDTHPK